MRFLTKIIISGGIAALGFFAYSKGYINKWYGGRKPKISFKTEPPVRKDILRKKIFSGHLIPEKEVDIQAHITGIVEKLFVKVGDYVQQGTPIARIKIRPNIREVEEAKSERRLCLLRLDAARKKYTRDKQLFNKKMLAKEKYEASLREWNEAKENFSKMEKKLQILERGYTTEHGVESIVIVSTTKGTVLDLPVKEGSMVREMSSQGEGTSVTVIGDMDHFLFSAKVNELDVISLKKGMTFDVSLNAFKKEKLKVTLTKIAPKADAAAAKEGLIKFHIEGVVHIPKNFKAPLRAGNLALAEVIVDQVSNVLAVPERMIETEDAGDFIKCVENGQMVKKKVVLGLSDGMYVEVKEGITASDQLLIEEAV